MRAITRAELREAVAAYNAGDLKPYRGLRWRAFCWGLRHPCALGDLVEPPASSAGVGTEAGDE